MPTLLDLVFWQQPWKYGWSANTHWYVTFATSDYGFNWFIFIALCIEWAKPKAWADWWEEEVVLLNEEMWRILKLKFCNWKAAWWESWIMQWVSLLPSDGPLVDGLWAYAYKQAALECEIFKKWALKWKGTCNCAIPVIFALMGEDWVVPSREEMSVDDLANDLIELELDDLYGGDVVGSDCED